MKGADYPHYKEIGLRSVYLDDVEHMLNILTDCADKVFIEVSFNYGKLVRINSLEELKRHTGRPISTLILEGYLPSGNQYVPRRIRLRIIPWSAVISMSATISITQPNDTQLLGLQHIFLNYLKRRGRVNSIIIYIAFLVFISLFTNTILLFAYPLTTEVRAVTIIITCVLAVFIYALIRRREHLISWQYSHQSSSWLVQHKDELIAAAFAALIGPAVTYLLSLLNLAD